MRPLRVAIAHPYVWPEVRRGGERYADDLAGYLTGAGHDVALVAYGDHRERGRVDGVARHRYRARGGRLSRRTRLGEVDLFGACVLPGLLAHRFDVVHALVPSAALAARLAGQRTVYTLLGHPSPDQLAGRPASRRLMAAAVRRAHVAAALSGSAAEATAATFGRRPLVLPPGVDLARFPLEGAPRTGTPVLLFASDLGVRRKGLDVLLAAVARLLPERAGLRVVLAGPGDPRWAFAALPEPDRAAVRAATTVAGAGTPQQLLAHYRAATLTALPAREEAFGLVCVESLACGTPVVCAAGSGMTEIVADRAVGRATPYGDVPALAAALADVVELAARPQTPAACRAAARRYGWAETVGPAHVALYDRLRGEV